MGLEPFLLVEYLAPRWKKLSQSLIGSVAICMVALVVSLILVFFSVTDGLERMWIEKLTALSSPIRIVPKPAYYDSYYYQIDALSSEAGFQQKSLREKLLTDHAVQYNELLDEELPDNFPTPLLNKEGKPRDLVKELADYARKAGGYESFFTVYEVAPVSFEIQINRTKEDSNALPQNNVFSQHGLITSFSEERLKKLLIPTRVDNENKMTELAERLQLFQTQFPSRAPVFLPKGYQEAGFAIGDLGEIFYDVPTLTITQTMHAPFVIAGFYDPGLLAIGVRFLLAPSDVVTSIISQMHADDVVDMSGFHLYIPDYHEALTVKETLQKSLESNGLSPYFTVESYHDYSYAKDFLKELKSQKKSIFTDCLVNYCCCLLKYCYHVSASC
jgi:hypothetical protein